MQKNTRARNFRPACSCVSARISPPA